MSEPLRILIVDDNEMMVKTLQDILRIKGYEVEAAYSGSEALEKAENKLFDCVISDIKMPGLNGVELYRAIKTRQPELPVILITAYAADELVKEGLEEGVIAVLTKPLDLNLLLNFLSTLRQERSVIIIDDDVEFCRTLGDILRRQQFNVTQIVDPAFILENLNADRQVILLDMKLNRVNGLDILRQIREQQPYLPVVLITGYGEEMAEAIETGLMINAHSYFHKPLRIEALLQVLTQIDRQELSRRLGRPVKKK